MSTRQARKIVMESGRIRPTPAAAKEGNGARFESWLNL
jgi:hypothetical protein